MFIKYIINFLLIATLHAQVSTSVQFGFNHSCAFGPGSIFVLNLPRIGNTYTYYLTSSGFLPSSNYLNLKAVLFGFSNTKWGGYRLPMLSSTIQSNYSNVICCGDLLVSIDQIDLVPIYSPPILIYNSYLIPSNSSLLGLSFYQQLISFNSSLSVLSVEFGIGQHSVIGI